MKATGRSGQNGEFNPNGTMTRGEFLVALVKTMGYKPFAARVPLSDIKPGDPLYDYFRRGVSAGVAVGYADGTFRPNEPVSREEAGRMLAQALIYRGKAPVDSPLIASLILSVFSDRNEVSAAALQPVALSVYEELLGGPVTARHARAGACVDTLSTPAV